MELFFENTTKYHEHTLVNLVKNTGACRKRREAPVFLYFKEGNVNSVPRYGTVSHTYRKCGTRSENPLRLSAAY